MPKTVVVVVPSLHKHDAVGADALAHLKWLQESGYQAHIYAEHVDAELSGLSISRDALAAILLQPDAIALYHMCVYWQPLMTLLQEARCRVVIKYHNMTPPEFFAGYDHGSFVATNEGLRQAQAVVRDARVHGFVAQSSFSRQCLEDLGLAAGRCRLQAPYVALEDFVAQEGARPRHSAGPEVIFVGRLVPNKGHRHLLATVASYVQFYGPQIRLRIIGSVAPSFRGYHEELLTLARDLGISAQVEICQQLSFPELLQAYQRADAFLVMSEHEGFCVPIIEAQQMRLAVLALDNTAIAETLGPGQMLWPNPDYDLFAVSLRRLYTDAELRAALIQQGLHNRERFVATKLAAQLVEIIEADA